jgi:hypothetical protein
MNFRKNIAMCSNFGSYMHIGVNTYHQPTVRSVTPELFGVDQWLKVTDIDPPVYTGIFSSNFEVTDD